MDINKVIFIFGKSREFAKAMGLSDYTVNRYKNLGNVPEDQQSKAKRVIKKHKKKLDQAFEELMQ